jgi:hypothetical protein
MQPWLPEDPASRFVLNKYVAGCFLALRRGESFLPVLRESSLALDVVNTLAVLTDNHRGCIDQNQLRNLTSKHHN